jgi:methylenetetrahydrofolate reductase (NADPH)
MEIGVNWAYKQVEELFNKNAPAVHFYILQNIKPINMLFKKLKL